MFPVLLATTSSNFSRERERERERDSHPSQLVQSHSRHSIAAIQILYFHKCSDVCITVFLVQLGVCRSDDDRDVFPIQPAASPAADREVLTCDIKTSLHPATIQLLNCVQVLSFFWIGVLSLSYLLYTSLMASCRCYPSRIFECSSFQNSYCQ